MKFKQYPDRLIKNIISVPFIYFQIVPLIFCDICISFYHAVCFPLYGIPKVKRSQYIRVDRQKLAYLNGLDKLHCMYCGYANGFIHYAQKIAADTEVYWCGIKHKEDSSFIPPPHHKDFLAYGDEKAYQEFVMFDKNAESTESTPSQIGTM